MLYVLALPAAITAEWIRGTVLSTSGYAAAVAPLAADPAVRATVRTTIDGEVSLVLSHAIKTAAPSPVSILAGPLSGGLGRLAGNAAGTLMASPGFQRLWTAANTEAHSQIISVLNGNSSAVTTSGDEVVLNLAPLITAALKDISGPLSRLTGKTITPPAISAVPATACRQIASLARTRLSADCGQIPLVPASTLTRARLAFRLLDAGTLTLVILAPAAGAAALLAASRRRRTLLQMAIGGGLTILTASVAVTLLRSSLTTRAQPRYQPVLTAILQAPTGGFFTLALWCMITSLILASAALLSGSRPCATAIRSRTRHASTQRPPPLPQPSSNPAQQARSTSRPSELLLARQHHRHCLRRSRRYDGSPTGQQTCQSGPNGQQQCSAREPAANHCNCRRT